MDTIIREINDGLKILLDDLFAKKETNKESLNTVTEKINEKVDEAKQYKIEVDNAKEKIKELELEIKELELDLSELNDRFGNKDLTAVLEAGNKEINSKIMDRQNQITKHRQKIGELTERARSIKDLLINLKKDKKIKEERLETFSVAYTYYNDSLMKIVEYAKDNPNSLENYSYEPTKYQPTQYDYSLEEPTTAVFEEIESMNEEPKSNKNKINKEIDLINEKPEPEFDFNDIASIKEPNDNSEEEKKYDDLLDKLKKRNLNLEEINKTIDNEYESIFGNQIEVEEPIEEAKPEFQIDEITENLLRKNDNASNQTINPVVEPIEEPRISRVENNHFDFMDKQNAADLLNEPLPSSGDKSLEKKVQVVEFFNRIGIDFNRFDNPNQDIIIENFNEKTYSQIVNVLKNNNINLGNIYSAPNVFTSISSTELDSIISKLLISGQTTMNIELVLDQLALVNVFNLNKVIEAQGPNIKKANITDIIFQAKNHSKSIGGFL